MKISIGKSWILPVLLAVLLSGCAQPRPLESTQPQPYSDAAPPEAEALWQQAEQAHKAGKVSTAIPLYERIIQNYPNSAIAARSLHTVGNIYLAQGQPERALQYYDYLLYTYPRWSGVNMARLDRFRALSATGKKRQVMRDAIPLWEASNGQPQVRVNLAAFMAGIYGGEGDIDTGFDWVAAGFSAARTPEENKLLSQACLELLKNTNEAGIQRLYRKNPSDFMKVFLDYRLAQIDMDKGQQDTARNRYRELLSAHPSHPLAPELQMALRGAPPPSADTTRSAAIDPGRIGVLVPLNGTYAKFGDLVLKGLQTATSEWNANYPGSDVTLVVKDAQADEESTSRSLEELAVDQGVLAVIGPLGTQASRAAAPLADRYGIPLLPLTQKEDDPGASSFVVHVFLDNRELLRALVRHCREKLGYARFAVLYPDDRYGQRLSKAFSEVVKEFGGSVMASVSYKDKTTDFKEPIQKLLTIAKKNAPPTGVDVTPFEALFIPDQVQAVSLIAPQLPYNNVVGVTLLGTNLWSEAPIVQTGGVYVEHAIFATPFNPESKVPATRRFIQKYEEQYNSAPSYLEAQAYDALMMLLRARDLPRSRATDRVSLLQNLLQSGEFEGAAGIYRFTPSGELDRTYFIMQVENDQLIQVAP
ncbi:MAG: penicillin-binding protein activator [Syntrophobacteraceae bacterium]|nr:penicillin-binding protein activator [Syntrophobacteraceae bacterium]